MESPLIAAISCGYETPSQKNRDACPIDALATTAQPRRHMKRSQLASTAAVGHRRVGSGSTRRHGRGLAGAEGKDEELRGVGVRPCRGRAQALVSGVGPAHPGP